MAEEMRVAIEFLKGSLKPDEKEILAFMLTRCADKEGKDAGRIMLVFPTVDDHRFKMMEAAGEEMVKQGNYPAVAAFVTGAWVVTQKTRDAIDVMPSKHPDRKEVVVVVAASHDLSVVLNTMLPVYRTEEGHMRIMWGEASVHDAGEAAILNSLYRGAKIAAFKQFMEENDFPPPEESP